MPKVVCFCVMFLRATRMWFSRFSIYNIINVIYQQENWEQVTHPWRIHTIGKGYQFPCAKESWYILLHLLQIRVAHAVMGHWSCAWAILQILNKNAYAVQVHVVPLLQQCLKLHKLGVELMVSPEFIKLWHLYNSTGGSSFTLSSHRHPYWNSLSRELCLGVPDIEMIIGL